MKRIVRGNDFALKIPVSKKVGSDMVPFSLTGCTDIKVQLVGSFSMLTLTYSIDMEHDNVIIAEVKGDRIAKDTYSLVVSGRKFGNAWQSKEYEQIEIVEYNKDGDTEFGGTDEGDNSVEMDTSLVILPPSVNLEQLISQAEGLVDKANTAANTASEASKDASTALHAAENVNADLDDHVLKVTNREGVTKTLNLGDVDEVVTVQVSSDVQGVSVGGLQLAVYENHGDTPTTYVTDGSGKAIFRVPKGRYYEVRFPDQAGARSISPVGYTAILESRTIEATYKGYDERSETVTVLVQRHKDGEASAWENMEVFVTVGNDQEVIYKTNAEGKVVFAAPWGETVKVRVDKTDGYYVRFDDRERKFTAAVNERFAYFNFYAYRTGMFIVTDTGEKITIDEYKERGLTKEQAVGVSLITEELVQGDGVATLDMNALYKRSFSSRQWCNLQVLFESVTSNGSSLSDKLYYNGRESSIRVMAEAVERSLEVPAFVLADKTTLTINDKTLHGYIPALGQMRLMNTNLEMLLDIFRAVYADDEALEDSIVKFKTWWNGQWKWTSTQGGASNAWIFNSGPNNNGKTNSNYVLPFFAYHTKVNDYEGIYYNRRY